MSCWGHSKGAPVLPTLTAAGWRIGQLRSAVATDGAARKRTF